ncbi:unnamed protein product [Urochloa humidicola]
MPETTKSPPSPWADLPPELLCDIAGRLHAASDNARFQAVCRAWRVVADDCYAPRRNLLPWLLAPSAAGGDSAAEDQRCRCVFSRATYRAPGICVRDRRVAYANGGAAWVVRDKNETSLVNPLSAARLSFPGEGERSMMSGDEWLDYPHRIVSDDGSVLLYKFDPKYHDTPTNFQASFLSPGHRKWLRVSSYGMTGRCCAAACYRGRYVVWVDTAYCHVLRPNWRRIAQLPDEPGKARRWSYLLTTCRGELLLASLLRDKATNYLSVSLHEFRLKTGDEQMEVEWVRRGDSDSDLALLDGDVMFLGFPGSFVVEAARFGGELSGGAAYFVLDGWKGGPCRVCRYSFREGRVGRMATLVETLPAGWHDTKCMWFLPDPQISAASEPPNKESFDSEPAASSGDLQACANGGARRRQQLTIYARNLSRKVDNSQLQRVRQGGRCKGGVRQAWVVARVRVRDHGYAGGIR